MWPSGTCGRRWAASNRNSLKISICSLMGFRPPYGSGLRGPMRVGHAVRGGEARVFDDFGPVHGLQEKMGEVEILDCLGREGVLGEDELEFVSGPDVEVRASLGAHANPVETGRKWACPVGLNRALEALLGEEGENGGVELEGGFAAREDNVWTATHPTVFGPGVDDPADQLLCALEAAAAGAVGADEVGVAELADSLIAIAFTSAPQVASGEAAEDRGPACLGAFSLQSKEEFLHRITHVAERW